MISEYQQCSVMLIYSTLSNNDNMGVIIFDVNLVSGDDPVSLIFSTLSVSTTI